MNRQRAAKKGKPGDMVSIDCGHLNERDPNRGIPVACYVCGTMHAGLGVARIRDKSSATYVPLCEPCLANDAIDHAIVQKFWGANLDFRDMGKATTEQIRAMAQKLSGATAH
jgi:hypothetical protein